MDDKFGLSRRDLFKAALGASAVAAFSGMRSGARAQGSDVIKVGLIGSGDRGRHDTIHCLKANDGIELVAMGDLVKDRLDKTLEGIRKAHPDKVKVTPETCFVGWDAYKKVLESGCDLVILTTPPAFRPLHFQAAIEAGKHVFMEKPIAVDPVGVRSVIETSAVADSKNLCVVAGTQARRMNHRIELVKRIQDGQIGEIISGQVVRIGDGMRGWGMQERPAGASDMEWQVRRWLFHTWLSGDFIVEMHVHELDIMDWLMGATPVKALGLGGRQVRTEPQFGDAYDHFSVNYEYPNGIPVSYVGAQIDKSADQTFEKVYGTKGVAYTSWKGSQIDGQNAWKYDAPDNDPVIQEFKDLVDAIRGGKKLNEGKRIAESTMTAILGRMSAYTGRELKYSWAMNSSKLSLVPSPLEFGAAPKIEVPMPGITPLV